MSLVRALSVSLVADHSGRPAQSVRRVIIGGSMAGSDGSVRWLVIMLLCSRFARLPPQRWGLLLVHGLVGSLRTG